LPLMLSKKWVTDGYQRHPIAAILQHVPNPHAACEEHQFRRAWLFVDDSELWIVFPDICHCGCAEQAEVPGVRECELTRL